MHMYMYIQNSSDNLYLKQLLPVFTIKQSISLV